MSVEFMVLSGPRSGTTWVSQLLTTDTTLCLHDPLVEHTMAEIEGFEARGKRIGVADTGAIFFPEQTAAHRARKVVLWRDPAEINASMRALGHQEIDAAQYNRWRARWPTECVYHWRQIFHEPAAADICAQLDVPFCKYRFRELVKVNMQPEYSRLPVNPAAVQELMDRVKAHFRP